MLLDITHAGWVSVLAGLAGTRSSWAYELTSANGRGIYTSQAISEVRTRGSSQEGLKCHRLRIAVN